MTPLEAINILDQATDPTRAGKLTRGDYVAINGALITVSQFVSQHYKPTSADVPPPREAAAP